jgi:hypothetical protein
MDFNQIRNVTKPTCFPGYNRIVIGNTTRFWRSLILVAVLYTYSNKSLCQYHPTIEPGKNFIITLDFGLGSYQYDTVTLICDTLINDHSYLTLYDRNQTILGFYREDTTLQEVYYLGPGLHDEVIWYTYNKDAGDTAVINGSGAVVQEVKYEFLYEKLRKVLVINPLLSLIEGAGTSRYGIVSSYSLPFPWPSLIELHNIDTTCAYFLTSTPLAEPSSISIRPNPFADFIQIQNMLHPPSWYALYDIRGHVLLKGYFVETIVLDTGMLPAGFYILRVNDDVFKVAK